MLKNFLLTSFRVIIRNKGFSIINIIGFAIGIACSILILLWVNDEISYDSSHINKDLIFRVLAKVPTDDGELNVGVTPAALAPLLKQEYPEIKNSTRFKGVGTFVFHKDDKRIAEPMAAIAESRLFDIFSFPFVEGDPSDCLDEPYSIVLTKDVAVKYFGDKSAIGESLELTGLGLFKVSAVIENVSHCHFQFSYLIPFIWANKLFNDNIDELGSFNYTTYLLLKEGVDSGVFEEKIAGFLDQFSDENDNEGKTELFIQNLMDIYLKSDFSYDFTYRGDISNVYNFSFISLIILLIACINYMNLSTARSANRAKEIGLRKVLGGKRKHIILQFYFESVFVTLPGFLLALIIVELTLPWFSNLAGKEFTQNIYNDSRMIVFYLLLAIITALVSGSYPALHLSSFEPIKVLKGKMSAGASSGIFRKVLVIVQFSIAMALIAVTIIVNDQLTYINKMELGYNKSQLCTSFKTGEVRQNYDLFKSRLLENPGIKNVTAISNPITYAGPSMPINSWDGNAGEQSFRMHFHSVDYDFIETMEIGMLMGRSFTRNFNDDSAIVFLINETAMKRMGLENPVGSMMTLGDLRGRIVGVFKDFNYNTLHHKIEPLTLILSKNETRIVFFRIEKGKTEESLRYAEQVWNEIEPEQEFNYVFMDDRLEGLYRSEQRVGHLFKYFAFFAIFISCLGLFGLASFMTDQRQKEVGVRKVLGSGGWDLVILLTKEFVRWVLFAGIIGLPLANFLSKEWLENFYYKVEFGVFPFISAISLALIIAIITVSFKTYRAATQNPVDAIRYE